MDAADITAQGLITVQVLVVAAVAVAGADSDPGPAEVAAVDHSAAIALAPWVVSPP
jgi:hypothetical protein